MRFRHERARARGWTLTLGIMITSTKSTHRLAVAAAAAASALALGVLLPSQQAHAATVHAAASDKPTIVLVHGAWADASSFAPQTAALQQAGYTVLVAPNPLRGIENDTTALVNFLNQRTSGPVVLVGHSYGGVVITGAALADPDVKALVYVDAYAPDDGESVQQLTSAQPGSLLAVPDPTSVFDFVVPYADAPLPEYDSFIKTDTFKAAFAASLPSAVTDVLAASQSPVTLGALATPFTGTPAWKTIPSWFFIGTADKVIPAAEQRVMAERAHGTTVEADAPHLSMLDKPGQVTKLITAAARSIH